MTVDRLRIYEDALRLICRPMAERTGFNCFNDYHIAWQALKDAAALDAASPLTTPTPDRLAALEAVAKTARHFAAGAHLQSEHNDDCDIAKGRCICGLSKLAAAFATLDTASPLTTPTPDQGALERARDLWRDLCEKDDRTSPEEYPDMALITEDEFVYCMTAAASEARAAAIMEIEWLRRLRWCRPRLKHAFYQASLDKYLAAGPSPAPADEPALVHSVATPAQSEGK